MPAAVAAPRMRRLGSLSNKGPQRGQPPKPPPRPAARQHTCCDDPNVEDDGDGHMVCRNCFTQISEANIVADVTFQEDSRGAATVQGGFIAENATHARTLGSSTFRRVGGGERNTQQEIEANGRRRLAELCPQLGISDRIMNQANQLFVMATGHNFSAGRSTPEVIGACLYAACRRHKDNTVLLIDISELLGINVFRLGEVWKTMCKDLYIEENNTGVGYQYIVEVESLIMKYCRKLEFGEATKQVAEDAAKLVKRMKHDWIVTGRHPAGLCGACIILAARMNNFRRTTREIVYVSKVTDATIMKRVEEFRRTKAAALTVDQFREYGLRLKETHDPPILYESQLKSQKFEAKKRKRHQDSMARETIEISDDESTDSSPEATPASATDEDNAERKKRRRTSTAQTATPAPTQQEPRRDADGFLIPALPVDPAITGQDQNETESKKRGRRKKPPPEPVIITEEELVDEADLEKEIEEVLHDDQVLDSRNEVEKAKSEKQAEELAKQEKQIAAQKTLERRTAEGITWFNDKIAPSREEITAEDLEAEFADDPEVQNCLLSEAEQLTKERIWVTHNEDWLRAQHEKKLLDAVAQSAGRKAKKGPKRKRKQKSRMGDGTTLAEAPTPVETPAEASALMLAKRAPNNSSAFVNWELLGKMFAPSTSSSSASRTGSITPSENGGSRNRTPSTAGRTAGAAARETASPSPSAGRGIAGTARRSMTPILPRPPTVEPEIQPQQVEGAEEEELSEGDPGDYVDDPMDYESDAGTPPYDDDDREDIGEEDYQRAINSGSRFTLDGTYGDDDDFD